MHKRHLTEQFPETQPLVPILYGGRYLPGVSWSDTGSGLLWAGHTEAMHDIVPSDEGRMKTSCPGDDWFSRLSTLMQNHSLASFTPELQLYVRAYRLAVNLVAQGDVVAYTAPEELTVADWLASFYRLTQIEEDGWIDWSGLSSPFVASWVPSWLGEQQRALRYCYIAEAETHWRGSWTPLLGWPESNHGMVLLDAFICHAVDWIMREVSSTYDADTISGTGHRSPYQISYRGEEEMLSKWKAGLTARGDSEPFPADGWLVWRTLKQVFAGSGWREKWLQDRTGNGLYQLEFVLVPPSADLATADWRIEYHIRHRLFDSSAPLFDWWQSPDRTWRLGRDLLIEPDVWILPLLRQAGELFEPIAASLKQAAPFACSITPEQIVPFVTTVRAGLMELGCAVRTPALHESVASNIRIRVQVKRVSGRVTGGKTFGSTSNGWFDAGRLVDFDWSVAIEGAELTRAEFETMVERNAPYLQLDGSWRLIPVQAILDQVRLFDTAGRGPLNLLQFSRSLLMSETSGTAAPGLQVEVVYDEEAALVERMMDVLAHAHEPSPVPPPQGFRGSLRHYQAVGYAWLLRLREMGCGGCLADDMGLGKTIQVLAFLLLLKEQRRSKGAHLLLCPMSLLANWRAETSRFAPDLHLYIHHGSDRNTPGPDGRTPLEVALETCDIVMTTYSTVLRDLESFRDYGWDAVIADEAQNIKNADTKQAQAVRSLPGQQHLALTGTPIENRLEELWSIIQFTNPGYLGSLSWFRKAFAGPIAADPQDPAARQLHRVLQPILLRRRKTEPAIQMELPEKWEVNQYAGLTPEQASLYQSVVNRLFTGIGRNVTGMSRRGQILAALVRLKQVCDHPCLVVGGAAEVKRSAKLRLLLDLLGDVVDDNESALVFTQFRDMGELLCDAIEAQFGWRPQFLHGGQTAAARGQIVESFQSGTDKSQILVLSLKAGGVGLNLTRANHVFHYDRWWNPAVEDQATDRVFRIGQTRDVQVHKLVCSGTLEERIDELIASKRVLSAAVVGESEGWVTEFDNEALRELFELDVRKAVEEDD